MALESISIDTETSLDVIGKYAQLSTALTDVDSMYLKAKETLDELFKTNTMTAVDKSNIISTTYLIPLKVKEVTYCTVMRLVVTILLLFIGLITLLMLYLSLYLVQN